MDSPGSDGNPTPDLHVRRRPHRHGVLVRPRLRGGRGEPPEAERQPHGGPAPAADGGGRGRLPDGAGGSRKERLRGYRFGGGFPGLDLSPVVKMGALTPPIFTQPWRGGGYV